MTSIRRRVVQWGLLLIGIVAIGNQVNHVWPRENRIILRLPKSPVRRVKLDLFDGNEELLRTVELFPRPEQSVRLEYVVNVPKGLYRLDIDYEVQVADSNIKTPGVGWTRVGVRHQIRMEGEDYRFPPPEETR